MTLLRILCVLHILSGIAGVVAGEESAAGGWWLIVVFSALLLLTFRGTAHKGGSANVAGRRFLGGLPITAAVAVLAVVIIGPAAFVVLAGA